VVFDLKARKAVPPQSATVQAEQSPSHKPDDGRSRTQEREPDEDEERERRPRRREDEARRRQRKQNRAGFLWLFGFPVGDFVALFGLLILLGYWLGYDTTVSSGSSWSDLPSGSSRTYNIGLVNNREVGTMAGAAIMLAGLVCSGFARLAGHGEMRLEAEFGFHGGPSSGRSGKLFSTCSTIPKGER